MRINWRYKCENLLIYCFVFIRLVSLQSTYQIVSYGKILSGFHHFDVIQNLQKFFYIDPIQAKQLLNNRQQVIHERLDQQSAQSICEQLTKMGLQVSIEAVSSQLSKQFQPRARHRELSIATKSTKASAQTTKLIHAVRFEGGAAVETYQSTVPKPEPSNIDQQAGWLTFKLLKVSIIAALLLSMLVMYFTSMS